MGMSRPAEAKPCGRLQPPNLTQTGGTLWRLGCELGCLGSISGRAVAGLDGRCWFLGGMGDLNGRFLHLGLINIYAPMYTGGRGMLRRGQGQTARQCP
jgi:hypothetical protein